MPIRVFIIDQHEILRAGIKQACSHRDDLEIVGEADNLMRGSELIGQVAADVLIVDPDSCRPDGLERIARIHQEMPALRILVFTTEDGPRYAQQIMRCGASGYLIKAAGLDEIVVAVRSVHLGRTFISHSESPIAKPILPSNSDRVDSIETPLVDIAAPPQLSGRETEVLALLADGLTNKQAAETLFLSIKTVETYRARIMKKHGLKDRSELVRFARRVLGEMSASA